MYHVTITDHATLLQSIKAKQEKNKRLRFSIFAGEEKDLLESTSMEILPNGVSTDHVQEMAACLVFLRIYIN